MRIYCDGAYKDGVCAVGVVVVDHNIILRREGHLVSGNKSFTSEVKAFEAALKIAAELHISEIYTDCDSIKSKFKLWIPRRKNQIAHGMATLSLKGFDWRQEIREGEELLVIDTLTPMRWNVKKRAGGVYNTALSNPEYRKLIGRQLKRYSKEVIRDFKHPVQSIKRQSKMVRYHVNPTTGRVTKRSPVGVAATGSFLFGIPIHAGVEEFTGKDAKKRPFGEKLTRSLSMALPMASPRALPSMLAYQIPDMLFKKKKPVESPR